ncbi:universal stress protein [Natrialbaceae archaeon A-gly3]
MTDVPENRVLVPIEILRGQDVPEPVIDTFASTSVVLLGYHEIPEQTAPGQARMQFENKAQKALADFSTAFEDAGCDVSTRLVFTHDPLKTIERVAAELRCDSVLLLNPAPVLEQILVAIREEVNVEHIARLVGQVMAESDVEVTLLHVTPDNEAQTEGERLLETASETLEENGIDRDRIVKAVVVDDKPLDALLEAAEDSHLVVVEESKPTIRDRIWGDISETIAEQTVNPVLVVRRDYLEVPEKELEEAADDSSE